jgi:hypothetical protein
VRYRGSAFGVIDLVGDRVETKYWRSSSRRRWSYPQVEHASRGGNARSRLGPARKWEICDDRRRSFPILAEFL